MPDIIDAEPDAMWKTQMRDRTQRNLDIMLQDAHIVYKQKVADNLSANTDVRLRLELEYKQDVQNLRYIAEEELRAEMEREEQERKWSAQAPWQHPEDVDQTIIEEQLAILNQIRNPSSRPHVAVQEYNGAFFQQGSSSRPSDEPHSPIRERSRSIVGGPYSFYAPQLTSAVNIEPASVREARLRAEKHEKQQEEFRKRAEAIQQRKRQERQFNSHQLNWTETMSSSSSTTSASDQEPTATAEKAMGEEDIINLVIFHDQQWTFISSLPHLQWTDFPWPVLSFSSPKRKEELTVEVVVEYIFAPLTVHGQDRAVVKDRLKDLIRRWHPDRFEIKYLALVADLHEREMVREGAGVVARVLNDLLGKWNDL